MADKPQINPRRHITPIASPPPTALESHSPAPPKRLNLQNHRFPLFFFLGLAGAAVLLLGLIILILSFTVFKVNDPQLTMNALHIDRLLVPGLGASFARPFSLNATLTADISVSNPNAASFRFRNSTTGIFYRGELVGVAYAPEGKVRARRALRMNVTVDVMADRVVMETNAAGVVLGAGWVNISSFTEVWGRVYFMGIYKKDLDVLLNCSFTLGVFENRFVNRVCEANVL